MFEKEKIIISEIYSVVYVKAGHPDRNHVRYGPKMPKYELVYKLSGECVTTFNKKVLRNLPHTAEFLPKTDNADYTVDFITQGECIDIHFDTESPMPKDAMLFDVTENKKLEGLFRKICNLWLVRKDGYEYDCMSVMYEILSELSRHSSNYIPSDKYLLIEKGIDFLREHCLEKNIDFYEPSRLCGISYTYFKRLFMMKFGVPPIQYVSKLKLDYAASLVSSKRYGVGEIAEMCGFDSVYYFSKKFKDTYGVSPKNYIS